MSEQTKIEKEVALENVITSAVQIPGVKVNRNKFLSETFASENVVIQDILDYGPIEAGISQEKLSKLAQEHPQLPHLLQVSPVVWLWQLQYPLMYCSFLVCH